MTPKPRRQKKQDEIVIPKPQIKKLFDDEKYFLITGWISTEKDMSIDKLRVKIEYELNRGDGIHFEVNRATISEFMPKASKGGKAK